MYKVLKTILVFILTISAVFSSLMIHIYNTTSVSSGSFVGTPLTKNEVVIYDVYIYILCISTLLLAGYWIYNECKQIKNPHL